MKSYIRRPRAYLQNQILEVLPEKGMGWRELAGKVGLSLSAINNAVRNLEKDGKVVRVKAPVPKLHGRTIDKFRGPQVVIRPVKAEARQ